MNDTTTAPKIETTATATASPAKAEKKVKEPKPLNVCWSGSGRLTKNRFAPGMDARFHGWAKKVARGELSFDADTGVVSQNDGTAISTLPHAESIEEFQAHVADERPKAALRKAEADRKTAEKAEKARLAAEAKAAKTDEVEGDDETEGGDEVA